MHKKMLQFCSFTSYARMQGDLYQIQNYPGAVPTHDDHWLHGELYTIEKPGSLFDLLDDYEECSSAFSQPHEFVRKQVSVQMDTGECLKAWAYLYNLPVSGCKRIQSGCY